MQWSPRLLCAPLRSAPLLHCRLRRRLRRCAAARRLRRRGACRADVAIAGDGSGFERGAARGGQCGGGMLRSERLQALVNHYGTRPVCLR